MFINDLLFLCFFNRNEVNTKLNDITDLIQAKEKNRRFVHISCLLLQLAATPKKVLYGIFRFRFLSAMVLD
jgi:hypothetical protein